MPRRHAIERDESGLPCLRAIEELEQRFARKRLRTPNSLNARGTLPARHYERYRIRVEHQLGFVQFEPARCSGGGAVIASSCGPDYGFTFAVACGRPLNLRLPCGHS
jgi:hypothetical protein